MADIDLTVGQGDAPLGVSNGSFLYERVVDFSETANQMASGDTMQLFDLPAGLLVCGMKLEVLTAQGATATGDVGVTGGDVNKYIAGANLNSAGVVMSGDATTAEPVSMETSGSYLSAAETVSLLANNALNAAKVRFQIFGFDLRSRLAA